MPSLALNALSLLLGSGLLASVGAVTITLSNFGNGALCTGPVLLTCASIAPNACCDAGVIFDETLFQGLPPTGIGIVYSGSGCTGKATNTGYGLNLCLSRGGKGANWNQVSNSAKRDEKNCTRVLPSTLSIGNRTFNIFGDVPLEVSEDMLSLFNNSRGIAEAPEVPPHFLPHELV
ncbi:hypothetical protein M409DRAFT_54186 [Zasmidium cellare ATCC 36951]|uniref:Hydrophobin n=1 Tax=Zasmidium cellare ATCC 36951 TaxID=1080233 RepID=A0A6A6CK30_ZASCE|nr:uncharacterized protein M409DRAFT_54186 [Zasmidium cellare ATCC 36951]KAF2167597.1 hypothetical protein M409DRAFT_54186 [Zasmidium cellare ATCC 36951]